MNEMFGIGRYAELLFNTLARECGAVGVPGGRMDGRAACWRLGQVGGQPQRAGKRRHRPAWPMGEDDLWAELLAQAASAGRMLLLQKVLLIVVEKHGRVQMTQCDAGR